PAGGRVVAIGNPSGLAFCVCDGLLQSVDKPESTVSVGTYEYYESTDDPKETVCVHTCPMGPGFSGGPLIDMSGRLAGVNWGGIPGFCESFAIPLENFKRFIFKAMKFQSHERLLQEKRYSYESNKSLGIAVQPMSLSLRRHIENEIIGDRMKSQIRSGLIVYWHTFTPNTLPSE
ncbi:unnamed protein product, partial [Medioppia subpectinata]